MKKILSVILVLSMVLALGVTAFAANPTEVEAGKTYGFAFSVPADVTAVKLSDTNGLLTFGEAVVVNGTVAVNVTAPAGTAGKITKIEVKSTDGKTTYAEAYVEVATPAAPPAPVADTVMTLAEVEANLYLVGNGFDAEIDMLEGVDGISAEAYNYLKTANFETITFIDYEGDYTWTLTRGDYTKMNVTAPIYFGVTVDVNLWTADVNDKDKDGNKDELIVDEATENAVLKALGNTKADVFYVQINDNVNIGNVASKPELVVDVDLAWTIFNNKFAVTAYKFDGEAATKIADGLAVKPATGTMALNLTAAGTYVFVADNYTVTPSAPSTEKPNTSTGANNAAAAVVALAVMAVAAVASKKIVK